MAPGIARYMLQFYKRLKKWRTYARMVAKAARDVLGESIEVYVFGGAAEDRLTALSDIDIAVVLSYDPSPKEAMRLKRRILILAMDRYGLPWDMPIDLHVVGPERFREIKKYSRVIRIEVP